jgi:hypothetical protein
MSLADLQQIKNGANYCLPPFGGDELRERASAVISQRNVHRLDAPTGFHDNQRRYSAQRPFSLSINIYIS